MNVTAVDIEDKGRVRILSLNGPKTRNAVSPPVYLAIQNQIIAAMDDPNVGAVVLRGDNGFFCSGGDVNNLKKSRSLTLAEVTRSTDGLHSMIKWIRACSKPVIAAVEGGAAGAGLSLAFACDLVVASEQAKFTVAYVKIGLTPDGGATYFLRQALPRQLVTEMCLFGRPVAASVLATHGLINQVLPTGEVDAAALNMATDLANGPVEAIATIKHLIESAPNNDLATHLDAEALGINRARFTDEAGEGMSAFIEKRKPDFNQPI